MKRGLVFKKRAQIIERIARIFLDPSAQHIHRRGSSLWHFLPGQFLAQHQRKRGLHRNLALVLSARNRITSDAHIHRAIKVFAYAAEIVGA